MTQPDERCALLPPPCGGRGSLPAAYVTLDRAPQPPPQVVHDNNELICVWIVLFIIVATFLCIPVIMIFHHILTVMMSLRVNGDNELTAVDEMNYHIVRRGEQ